MKKDLEYRIRNITKAVMSQPWLCHHAKLEEIRAFLEFRAAGGNLEEHVVKEAFGAPQGHELFTDENGRRIDVDGIRYIPLMGVMAPKMNLMTQLSGGVSTEQAMKSVRKGLNDPAIKTILLHIDSPGGVSTLVPELAQTILDGRSTKRIVSFTEGMMASAALWVGTAATEVFASVSADIGSQGAYSIVMTDVKAAEDAGRTFHVIRAGEFKAIGIQHEELTEAGREELQRVVDELDGMFVSALAAQRGVSEQHVRDRFGRGKLFSAHDAVERKLIDGVVIFDELIDRERGRNSSATSVSLGGRSMKVTPKVKAAMFAQGCIESIEASDDVCVAYLRGVAQVTGKNHEDSDEQELIKLILSPNEVTKGIDHTGKEYVADVVSNDVMTADQMRADQRARNAEVRLAAKELGVPDSMVTEALCSDDDIAEVRKQFVKYAEGESGPVGIQVTESAFDKVSQAVVGAIFDRCGNRSKATKDELAYSGSFRDATFLEMARETLRVAGVQTTGERAKDARAFLSLGLKGTGQLNARTLHYASEPSANRVGDHPDALSNLMGRILDDAYDEAPATFEVYTKRKPDVPDERPKTFIESAVFQELDALGEDEKHKQLIFDSQIKAWVQVAKYGNKVGLTENMIINDDLGIFDDQLASLQRAAVNTVDNSCRSLLISNPTLVDGTQMFTLAKGNYIDTGNGAAPSETSASEHRRLHRLIKGFGSTRTINRAPDKGLFPAALEQAARRTFPTAFPGADAKVAETDSNRNTTSNMINGGAIDGMLDGYTNGDIKWWTIVSGLEPIVLAYLLGMGGATGRRTTWTDPDTGTRYVAVDMWAGFAPLNFRGTVLNEGA